MEVGHDIVGVGITVGVSINEYITMLCHKGYKISLQTYQLDSSKLVQTNKGRYFFSFIIACNPFLARMQQHFLNGLWK